MNVNPNDGEKNYKCIRFPKDIGFNHVSHTYKQILNPSPKDGHQC
jgi:hypothetical protein